MHVKIVSNFRLVSTISLIIVNIFVDKILNLQAFQINKRLAVSESDFVMTGILKMGDDAVHRANMDQIDEIYYQRQGCNPKKVGVLPKGSVNGFRQFANQLVAGHLNKWHATK